MMIMELMKLAVIVLFILAVVVFPIVWIVYAAISGWRIHTECKRQEKEHAFYKSNYTVDETGTKRLNGAWHK